jgi:hypothetical protein
MTIQRWNLELVVDRRIAQERYEEQNQRFNILLEEVRATNRRVLILEDRT